MVKTTKAAQMNRKAPKEPEVYIFKGCIHKKTGFSRIIKSTAHFENLNFKCKLSKRHCENPQPGTIYVSDIENIKNLQRRWKKLNMDAFDSKQWEHYDQGKKLDNAKGSRRGVGRIDVDTAGDNVFIQGKTLYRHCIQFIDVF